MTVKIEITAASAAEARQEMIGMLGDSYKVDTGWRQLTMDEPYKPDYVPEAGLPPEEGPVPVHVVEDALKATAPVEAPKRERGKPSPGKTRRTKEEIAEDEAADAAEAPAVAEPVAAISTGEERIDPTSPEDAAQDAADEAAEVAATRSAALTHDDLRAAVGRLQKRFGMAKAVEVTGALLGGALIDVPLDGIESAIAKLDGYEEAPATATREDVVEAMLAYGRVYDGADKKPADMAVMIEDRVKIFEAAFGAGITGLSKIPDTPEAYGKAVKAITSAIEANPYGRAKA